jgi:hypothetical protein
MNIGLIAKAWASYVARREGLHVDVLAEAHEAFYEGIIAIVVIAQSDEQMEAATKEIGDYLERAIAEFRGVMPQA